MKKLAIRLENIDNLKLTSVKLPQETIEYLNKQSGCPPYEYIKTYLDDNKLYKTISKKYIDYVNKTLPEKVKETCHYCNGKSKDENTKKCNNYHSEAQMNFYFASYEFVSVVERNKHLIKDNSLRKKLTLQFYKCFAFSNGRVIFDLEKMAMLCLKAGFLSLSRIFANNTALQNLSIINNTIDKLNDEELNADMFSKEKSIYLEPQKKFFKKKYEHYEREHFIEKEKKAIKFSNNKTPKKNKKNIITIPQYALYYYYLQDSGDIAYFENHPEGKVKAIAELIKKDKLNTTTKYFQKVYNSLAHYRTNRVARKQVANIDFVVNTMLKNFPEAKKKAFLELKEAKTKHR